MGVNDDIFSMALVNNAEAEDFLQGKEIPNGYKNLFFQTSYVFGEWKFSTIASSEKYTNSLPSYSPPILSYNWIIKFLWSSHQPTISVSSDGGRKLTECKSKGNSCNVKSTNMKVKLAIIAALLLCFASCESPESVAEIAELKIEPITPENRAALKELVRELKELARIMEKVSNLRGIYESQTRHHRRITSLLCVV